MKKKYLTPEIIVLPFSETDVICASDGKDGFDDGWEDPNIPSKY